MTGVPQNRHDWINELRTWVAPLLKIDVGSADKLLRKATTTELKKISAIQLEQPRDRAELLKAIVQPIMERTDPSRRSA